MKQLSGQQLRVSLGDKTILHGIDFDLQAGEMSGLIGPNGAGKTTLLRVLAGLLAPSEGILTLDESEMVSIDPQQRAKKIAYLAQSGTTHWPMSVERIVTLGRLPHLTDWQRLRASDQSLIEDMIQRTDIDHLRKQPFNTLSGGEKARALLARALVTEPDILLADEPVAALDLAHQLEVMALLREFCDQGGAVVVVLHDLRLAAHYCDQLQLLKAGSTLASGLPSKVLTNEHIENAYDIRIRRDAGSVTEAFALNWELS
ncbi:ABC transporter ATP-binding protein [Motiliproteus sp. MSK22-1]|uniref:ABC transporter ATP-binding protein n=1 Tax=Motiliproteus sp. MSK22-1 TaxID=1897630 RepID=UPI000976DC8F|nr:ABC transporter ATP-binding protein [Motiliproteus sp. MSK22-1]OMH37520.1 hypothetical protein BGP75_09075 [Motiliproteus sp. MSK22-1]